MSKPSNTEIENRNAQGTLIGQKLVKAVAKATVAAFISTTIAFTAYVFLKMPLLGVMRLTSAITKQFKALFLLLLAAFTAYHYNKPTDPP